MLIVKYKYNNTICADYLPVFNEGFNDYIVTDIDNGNNIITRTIEGDELPTLMRFGTGEIYDEKYVEGDELSLLEICDMNTSKLTSALRMFKYCKNLTRISCNWVTDNINDMFSMFHGCYKLEDIGDVSNWNTSKVTTLQYLFYGCNRITNLDVSKWDTSKVANNGLHAMFNGCMLLTDIDITKWNTNAINGSIANMFTNCISLTEIDVSSLNISNITRLDDIFNGCQNLIKIKGIENWDTSNATHINNIFKDCFLLEELDLSNWDTGNVNNMYGVFYNCKSLKTLKISHWNTINVNTMERMFYQCASLETLDLSGWNTGKVTKMDVMFNDCFKLKSIKGIENFNTAKVNTMSKMFDSCTSLRFLDLSNWNVENVTQMEYMFGDDNNTESTPLNRMNLIRLNLSNWKLHKNVNLSNLFYGNNSINEIIMQNSDDESINKIISNLPLRPNNDGNIII